MTATEVGIVLSVVAAFLYSAVQVYRILKRYEEWKP